MVYKQISVKHFMMSPSTTASGTEIPKFPQEYPDRDRWQFGHSVFLIRENTFRLLKHIFRKIGLFQVFWCRIDRKSVRLFEIVPNYFINCILYLCEACHSPAVVGPFRIVLSPKLCWQSQEELRSFVERFIRLKNSHRERPSENYSQWQVEDILI